MRNNPIAGVSAADAELVCSPASERKIQGKYECWTNYVSSVSPKNVYRENKLKYKNTHNGPVMKDRDVDALLRRKPNAVKNIINSLNEQMRQKGGISSDVEAQVHMHSLPGVYEPEFGKELQECNVSVKNRISIFDKKSSGTRLTSLSNETDDYHEYISYPTSPSFKGRSDSEFEECRDVNSNPQKAKHSDSKSNSTEKDSTNVDTNNGIHSSYFNIGELSGIVTGENVISSPRGEDGVYQTVGPSNVSYNLRSDTYLGSSELHLSCNSDNSISSSNDSFGPLHKEWNRNAKARSCRHKESAKLKCKYRSPRFSGSSTIESGLSESATNTWTPSILSSSSCDGNAPEKIELPLEVGLRDLDVHPRSICVYSNDVKPEPYHQYVRTYKSSFTVTTQKKTFTLRSVNVIKAGWTWMYSSKARRWFPKYLVIFYDDAIRSFPYQIHAKVRKDRTRQDDGVKSASSFWDIYKIYSKIGVGRHVMCDRLDRYLGVTPVAKSASNYPRCDDRHAMTTKSLMVNAVTPEKRGNVYKAATSPKLLNDDLHELTPRHTNNDEGVSIIPSGSRVYLTILRDEAEDIATTLRTGKFQELMEVDTSMVPYTRQHGPRNWLAGLICSTMGRDPLTLIHIPLVDGYECSFMPICAVDIPGIPMSYRMECARQMRVSREYEQWAFTLWEFVLRSRDSNSGRTSVAEELGMPQKGFAALHLGGTLKAMWEKVLLLFYGGNRKDNTNVYDSRSIYREEYGIGEDDVSSLRRYLMGKDKVGCDIGSPEHQAAVQRGFVQWIELYGYDDLAVNVNMYSLSNRLREAGMTGGNL